MRKTKKSRFLIILFEVVIVVSLIFFVLTIIPPRWNIESNTYGSFNGKIVYGTVCNSLKELVSNDSKLNIKYINSALVAYSYQYADEYDAYNKMNVKILHSSKDSCIFNISGAGTGEIWKVIVSMPDSRKEPRLICVKEGIENV